MDNPKAAISSAASPRPHLDEPGGQVAATPAPSVDVAPRQLLVRDSVGYLLSKIVPGFFGLISVPVFVRLIGVGEYGRLALILPLLMTLTSGAPGWLSQAILRFHPSPKDFDRHLAFGRAVFIGTAASVLILIIVVAPMMAAMHYPVTLILIAEVFSVAQMVYLVSLSRLQAQLQPGAVLRCEAVRAFACFVLPVGIVLAAGQRSYEWVFLGLALGYVPAWMLARVWQHGSGAHREIGAGDQGKQGSTRAVLRQFWEYGWPAGLWLMLVQALPVVGRYALEHYSGYSQAGTYASLYEVAVRAFSFFAFPITQAAHPRVMRYWNEGDRSAARSIIRHSIKYQILMFLPVQAIGVLFAGPLTALILGGRTNTPWSLLPLLMLGGFLWQIALLLHKPLEIMRRTKALLCGMTVALFAEIAGNVLLTPRLGMQGTAYVYIGGALLYICFVTLIVDREEFREEGSMTEPLNVSAT